MKEHISEAICVIVTSLVAGIIRYFEKQQMKKDQEAKSEQHFKNL